MWGTSEKKVNKGQILALRRLLWPLQQRSRVKDPHLQRLMRIWKKKKNLNIFRGFKFTFFCFALCDKQHSWPVMNLSSSTTKAVSENKGHTCSRSCRTRKSEELTTKEKTEVDDKINYRSISAQLCRRGNTLPPLLVFHLTGKISLELIKLLCSCLGKVIWSTLRWRELLSKSAFDQSSNPFWRRGPGLKVKPGFLWGCSEL